MSNLIAREVQDLPDGSQVEYVSYRNNQGYHDTVVKHIGPDGKEEGHTTYHNAGYFVNYHGTDKDLHEDKR